MQPMLIKVNLPEKSSFSITRSVFYDGFPGIWHFHDEYELTLILESSGTRMVGDHIERFTDGDLVLIGKNLPHTWRNDESKVFEKSECLVLHFMYNCLGNGFFDVPAMQKIQALLMRSHRGVKITGTTKDVVIDMFVGMENQDPATQVIQMLSILNLLTSSDDLQNLSSEGFANSIDESGANRLNQVYAYIMNHFQEDISLSKVAEVANMSPTGFSRYFKNRTRKSFTQFLIELKVGYACKLLITEDMTVSQVCYESGFQNMSNFNQQFKGITRLTPKKYQLLHAAG